MLPFAIGGRSARELVERFGSPLFVFDAAMFRARIAAMRAAFGEGVGIAFALKANPCIALVAMARAAGLGAEVASAGEILVAAAAGVPGEATFLSGPAKSDDDLRYALRAGARIHLESEREYDRVLALAPECRARPELVIRVQPVRPATGAGVSMAGATGRFGIDAARVPALARRVAGTPTSDLVGLHVHSGSQIFDAGAWLAVAAELIEVAGLVESVIERPLRSLDFGGGFGLPVHASDPELELGRFGRGMRDLLAASDRPDREAWIEPGRWLVGPAGVYLTRVVDIKSSGDRRHAMLDGGMHHFGAAAGFGAPMRRAWSIVHAERPDGEPRERVSLGGPLCTPADRFGRELSLPALEVGDLLALTNAGAYGLTYSPSAFLGRPTPAEVLVDGGEVRVVREPGRPEDALRGQHR